MSTAQKLVILFIAWVLLSGGGGSPFSKATVAVYVYEKDDGAPPSGVASAIGKLNLREGFTATMEDDDTRDASGEIAEQYKVPFAEAAKVGVPVLVVTGGGKVVKTVKAPKTEEEVLKAVP